jgi:hypothetical protein
MNFIKYMEKTGRSDRNDTLTPALKAGVSMGYDDKRKGK